MGQVPELKRKASRDSTTVTECRNVGNNKRNPQWYLLNSNSSDSIQNPNSNENFHNHYEICKSENWGQNDEIDTIGEVFDIEDGIDSEDGELVISLNTWIPHAVNNFNFQPS